MEHTRCRPTLVFAHPPRRECIQTRKNCRARRTLIVASCNQPTQAIMPRSSIPVSHCHAHSFALSVRHQSADCFKIPHYSYPPLPFFLLGRPSDYRPSLNYQTNYEDLSLRYVPPIPSIATTQLLIRPFSLSLHSTLRRVSGLSSLLFSFFSDLRPHYKSTVVLVLVLVLGDPPQLSP